MGTDIGDLERHNSTYFALFHRNSTALQAYCVAVVEQFGPSATYFMKLAHVLQSLAVGAHTAITLKPDE